MRIRVLVSSFVLSVPLAAQASWSQLYTNAAPPVREGAAMAFHEASASVVLLGGIGPSSTYWTDAWRLQGATWTQIAGPVPPARRHGAMVYDSVRQCLVLFGGLDNGGSLDDTWEWNGATWSQRLSASTPPARYYHGMAFDPVRGVTVLYGGLTGSVLADDHWEWNGTDWQQRTPALSPGARLQPTLVFDPTHDAVLLHGGSSPFGSTQLPNNDTWTWDGANWTRWFPATPPPMRSGGRAVADLHRGRVVLHGGGNDPFAWEWDGAEWRILLQASPGLRAGHVMAYDAAARRVVLHGGGNGYWAFDTWIYRTPLPATVEPFGSGCAGSAGTPALANVAHRLPWLGDTVQNRVSGIAPGEPGAIFVSSFGAIPPIDLTFLGLTGCDLLVPLDVLELAPAVAGAADWSYTVPNDTALAGVAWRQQAFPFDAAANPFGLAASNAVLGTFGVR